MCAEGETCKSVGFVRSAVMWELGSSVYLAVVSGHPNKMIAVFRLDLDTNSEGETSFSWHREEDLAVGQELSNLKAFKFSNGTSVHAHLYAVR